jgi:mannose-6-phosphate isomerase-like protein (cupin superfamily)
LLMISVHAAEVLEAFLIFFQQPVRNVVSVRWDHLTSFAWIATILPMATVDQKAVEKDWNARGFSCDLWIDAPGRVWRNFIHETDELVMLVEGEEEFEMNGQIHRLEIGQELLIPAGTYHTARNVGRTTSKWLYGYKPR